MTTCACGELTWQPGVLSIYSGTVHHWPEGLICFESEDLWAIADVEADS